MQGAAACAPGGPPCPTVAVAVGGSLVARKAPHPPNPAATRRSLSPSGRLRLACESLQESLQSSPCTPAFQEKICQILEPSLIVVIRKIQNVE